LLLDHLADTFTRRELTLPPAMLDCCTSPRTPSISAQSLFASTALLDPDAGTHTLQYNGHGELMRKIIAGDVRAYHCDILGRVDNLQTVDGTSQWVYDTQKVGRLSQSISASGVKTDYHYNNLVRPDETSWTVNGEVFKVSTTYDNSASGSSNC
jgi:YD repeat-containing protein